MERNYFASFAAGQQAGRQAREYQQQVEDRNAFRSLAPQILAGDLGAFEQAAAIDPKQAQAYQAAGDDQARRFKGALDYFDSARKTNNPQAVQAAFKQISPFLSKVTGRPAPEAYDEATMGPAFEQLRARIAMAPASGAGDVVQSQKVGADGFIYNTFRDGRIVNTGVKADRQMWLRDHPGMAPELVGKDGVTLPVGASVPPGAVEQIGGEQVYIDPDLPPQVQSELRATLASGQPVPAQLGARARPSEAQTAAQVEAARQGVQLQYAPAMQQIETQGAIAKEAGVQQVRNAAEAQSKTAQRQRDNDMAYGLYRTAMQGLQGALQDTATGPMVGRLPAVTASQQTAEGAEAAMAPVLKQMFRASGEGTFTDRDQELLLKMVPTRQDLPEAREAKIQNINRIVEQKLGQSREPQPAGGVRRARNPQTGEVLVLRNGQWVPE